MNVIKRIVCLANSRKPEGSCVAGRELSGNGAGPWIRPVSDRPGEEVSLAERAYISGEDPSLLDIIDIPFLGPRPTVYQPENWLIDPTIRWERVGHLSPEALPAYVENNLPWPNGSQSWQALNNRVPADKAVGVASSLKLIRVNQTQIRVVEQDTNTETKRKRVQARFALAGVPYGLWVTDPAIEMEFLNRPFGDYHSGENYLTVSLGEA